MRALLTILALMAFAPSLSQAAAPKPAPPAALAKPTPDAVPFFMNSGDLANTCDSAQTDQMAQVACVLYITGIVDAFGQNPATRLCLTMTATRLELASIMIAWLKKHPEQSASPAALSVNLAMKEAYPCK